MIPKFEVKNIASEIESAFKVGGLGYSRSLKLKFVVEVEGKVWS